MSKELEVLVGKLAEQVSILAGNVATLTTQNQILQNAITTAKSIDADASAALGNRIHLSSNATAGALYQTPFFTENAPAGQDTPGEGADSRPPA